MWVCVESALIYKKSTEAGDPHRDHQWRLRITDWWAAASWPWETRRETAGRLCHRSWGVGSGVFCYSGVERIKTCEPELKGASSKEKSKHLWIGASQVNKKWVPLERGGGDSQGRDWLPSSNWSSHWTMEELNGSYLLVEADDLRRSVGGTAGSSVNKEEQEETRWSFVRKQNIAKRQNGGKKECHVGTARQRP